MNADSNDSAKWASAVEKNDRDGIVVVGPDVFDGYATRLKMLVPNATANFAFGLDDFAANCREVMRQVKQRPLPLSMDDAARYLRSTERSLRSIRQALEWARRHMYEHGCSMGSVPFQVEWYYLERDLEIFEGAARSVLLSALAGSAC